MRKRNLIVFSILTISLFFSVEKNVFAESYIASSAPDQFTTNNAGKSVNAGYDAIMANTAISASSAGGNNIIDYHTLTNDKIFCIDRQKAYAPSASYRRTEETVDNGIVYIITHAQEYYNKVPGLTNVTNRDLEISWFTQVAIWKYQDGSFAGITSEVQTRGTEIFEEDSNPRSTYSQNGYLLWRGADALVTAAKNQSGTNQSVVNDLVFNYDGGHTVENGKIRTNMISIQNSNGLSSFSLDLTKMPNGTEVYNQSGSRITDLTNLPINTSFYLVLPIDDTNNYSFNGSISATASYTYYKGYKYIPVTDNTKQPVVLVTSETNNPNASLVIEGSHVEDTASSVSKVMYITGLFILLCGVGIIYVNVKPKKQEI